MLQPAGTPGTVQPTQVRIITQPAAAAAGQVQQQQQPAVVPQQPQQQPLVQQTAQQKKGLSLTVSIEFCSKKMFSHWTNIKELLRIPRTSSNFASKYRKF